MHAHGGLAASPWVQRWSALVGNGATVLDVACGSGRHLRWFAGRGCRVTGVDRDAAAVEPLKGLAELIVADIENGPWPLAGRQFDAVVVTNYLWRPLLPSILASVAPGGVLIYETFMQGNERFGKPSNPDFLLAPHELLDWCREVGLEIRAFEQGEEANAVRQRICAVRPA